MRAQLEVLAAGLILCVLPTRGWTQACTPAPGPCDPPGELALSAFYLAPIPPSAGIAMWIYGPVGESGGVGSIVCAFPNPGGSVTLCGGTGIPGEYIFQAQSDAPSHFTVDGGSATCGGLYSLQWRRVPALLPPHFVEPTIRGVPLTS